MDQWKIKLNKGILFKKSPREIKFLQKFKDFYLNRINSTPKKFSFWILAIVSFVFLLPFCLGGILASYISPRIETKPSWLKLGIIALVLIMTFQIGTGWTKNLLGMNTPPNIVVSNPITEEIKVKGVSTIEISGKINPVISTIKINNGVVAVTDDGDFTKKVSIIKGKNEIDIIGKHGSGITEKTIIVYRELTEEEIAEEKIREEEREARAEEKRKAKEEARKKAEAEAQAEDKVENRETQIKFKIENIVKETNSTAAVEITKKGNMYEIFVAFAANDNAFGNKYIKLGIQEDTTELYKALFNSGLPISIIQIGAVFPIIDKYGYEKNDTVYATELTNVEARKVNWDEDTGFLAIQTMPGVWTLLKSLF